MKGDFSRRTFDPAKRYSGVWMQQGRVQLDADWNEQLDILQHHLRTQIHDLLGPAGTRQSAAGFGIAPLAADGSAAVSDDFVIQPGRYYVGGVLCENDHPVRYLEQRDFPGAPPLADYATGSHARVLAYLDVWERDVAAVDDPALLEVALGGADTTIRTKTVWQVKLLPLPPHPDHHAQSAGHSPAESLPAWHDLVQAAARRARLTARCQAGGAGPDNHLYRVEIHRVETVAAADAGRPAQQHVFFKWSRENGSVAFRIVGDAAASSAAADAPPSAAPASWAVTVDGLQRDGNLLQQGDWVEITDDRMVLSGQPGLLYQITQPPDLVAQRLVLTPAPAAAGAGAPPVPQWAGAVLRRWDQRDDPAKPPEYGLLVLDRGQSTSRETIRSATSLEHGLLVVDRGQWQALEYGIEIRFDEQGDFRAGDYWQIPARSPTRNVDWPADASGPLPQPPNGIHHRYAPLAILARGPSGWRVEQDCRSVFQSATESVVSRAEDVHRLQDRIDQLAAQLRSEIAAALDEARGVLCYPSPQALAPGQVVAVDPADPQQIVPVDGTNARLLLGVVCERVQPGTGPARYRIATRGILPCQVVGNVEPGDLLVPSDLPGRARRAGFLIRPGTLLGKAVTAHTPAPDRPEGLVHVLLGPG